MALLVAEKVIISAESLDITDIFSDRLAIELFKYFDINKYSINLKPGQ